MQDSPQIQTEGFAIALDLVEALRQVRLELGEDVVIIGSGLIARIATDLVEAAGGFVIDLSDFLSSTDHSERCADVMIYTTNDVTPLAQALRLVRDRGRIVFLPHISSGPSDLNVYPDLHKRSLQIFGIGPSTDSPKIGAELIHHLVESERLHFNSMFNPVQTKGTPA
jgi:threonine dehydrogenase-like Zn-dependent dehydrogenase